MSSPSFTLSRRQALAGLTLCMAGSDLAWAQGPERPLRFILPFSTGSGVDTITRAASVALGKALGQPVVIENQPGAGGVLGTSSLTKSVPDGLTLSMVSNNHVIYPSVLKSLPFDPINDITPIAVIGSTPMVLLVNPKVAAKDMKELVALLSANPGKYNYGSSGNGTILQLAVEQFKEMTGTFITHIPYRGVAPFLQDLLGGQIDIGVSALPTVQAHIKSGALRAICVASAQRVAAAPDIPTGAEQGYPSFLAEGWFAVIGPKNLPPAQVQRIRDGFVSAFATAEVRDAMARQGNNVHIGTTEAAQAYFKSELAKYVALVKRAGVVAQ